MLVRTHLPYIVPLQKRQEYTIDTRHKNMMTGNNNDGDKAHGHGLQFGHSPYHHSSISVEIYLVLDCRHRRLPFVQRVAIIDQVSNILEEILFRIEHLSTCFRLSRSNHRSTNDD